MEPPIKLPIKATTIDEMKYILSIINCYQYTNYPVLPGLIPPSKNTRVDYQFIILDKGGDIVLEWYHITNFYQPIHNIEVISEMRLTKTGGLKVKCKTGSGYNFEYDWKTEVLRGNKISDILDDNIDRD